jgi:hypothetical protein
MKTAATETASAAPRNAETPRAARAMPQPPVTIVTRMEFAATPAQVWEGLMYYEQIEEPPPLHLRLLLPIPIRTDGSKSAVGDEAMCVYQGGHLKKRVTQIDACRHYGFEVVEQNLAIGRGLTLAGGSYTLRELPGGRTEVAVVTRYVSSKRPAWLWRPIEATVCHMFHRHLLAAIRRKIEAR